MMAYTKHKRTFTAARVLEALSQGDQHTTEDHHDRAEQPLSELVLAQEQTRPEDRADATQLEESGRISYQSKCNGCETEEWSDPREHDRTDQSARMRAQPTPGTDSSMVCSTS